MRAKKITITEGKPWGFKIAGGYELNQPIVVTKVEENTKAYKCGLRHGDILISVNGISLKYYVTRKEAAQHIMKAGQEIILEVIPSSSQESSSSQSKSFFAAAKFW